MRSSQSILDEIATEAFESPFEGCRDRDLVADLIANPLPDLSPKLKVLPVAETSQTEKSQTESVLNALDENQ